MALNFGDRRPHLIVSGILWADESPRPTTRSLGARPAGNAAGKAAYEKIHAG